MVYGFWGRVYVNQTLCYLGEGRSIRKLASYRLSTNLVGPEFEGEKSSRPKLSVIVMRSSV